MRASPITGILCCVFLICVPVESGAAIRIAEEVLSHAAYARFDYTQHVSAAATGDERAVRELLLLSRQTDAAAAIGHGVALVDLFQTIGEEMPARVARTLSSDDKRRVTLMMEAGVAYGFQTAPEEWTKRFPRMAAALKPFRFSPPVLLALVASVAFATLWIVRRGLAKRRPACCGES